MLIRMICPKTPAPVMPELVTGTKVALKMTGGVGDVLMAIGGTAYKIKEERPTLVTAIVRGYQIPLMKQVIGVDNCIESQEFNRLDLQMQYDVIVNFVSTFNAITELRRGDYYTHVSDRVKREVQRPLFKFKRHRSNGCIYIHPNASNPNRRWNNEKWGALQKELVKLGYVVEWLGTKDEYGYNGYRTVKLSNIDESLLGQAQKLADAAFFVGCDSGFAHIAGILGVPGIVLFGNTHPEDVIRRYPTLEGAHNFYSYDCPTRSLNKDCSKSKKFMESITVEQVLEKVVQRATPVSHLIFEQGVGFVENKKISLLVVGRPIRYLVNELAQWFEVEYRDSFPNDATRYEALLVSMRSKLVLTVKQRTVVVIEEPEQIRRAIRELLGT